MKINEVGEYIQECLRLLYWIYFKPYTLRKWLQDIHPKLEPDTNLSSLRSEFGQNLRLRRYANQSWWLTAIFPIVAVLIVAPIYSLFADRSFNWIPSSLFIIGWIGGIYPARSVSGRWIGRLKDIVFIYLGSILLWQIGSLILPSSTQQLIQQTLSPSILNISFLLLLIPMAFGVSFGTLTPGVGGIAFGTTVSVLFGIAVGMAFRMAFGFLFGWFFLGVFITEFSKAVSKVFGTAVSTTVGVLFGMTVGVAVSMAVSTEVGVLEGMEVGVSEGMEVGLTISAVFFFGILRRVYFWVLGCLWMLLGLRLMMGNSVLALRRLPPYFDQEIILPLPFMAEIIVEAYDQNPVAARSTIDYFITSTNQQAVAKRAMFGIGVRTLSQCRYVSDIIGSQMQLDWLPTDDKAFGTVLSRLLEISHNIDIAYQATTAYNKLELVDRSISDLQKLQTSLSTAASAGEAPLFGSITMRWLKILQDNRQALEIAAQESAEIPNPYLAGNSLEPERAKERFKGRQDLFRAIEELSLSVQPPVLLLYGRRRTGKTSALKYLPSRVSSDLIPLLVDFQGAASIQRMESVAEFMANEMTRTAESSRSLILPTISPEKLSSDPFYALQTWMDRVEQVAPNKRFLLCIDEFERLQTSIAASGSHAPLDFLRYVTQNRRQWIVLFSGSHRLEELKPYWSDYLIGTRTMPITYLQEAEARDLIQHPIATFPDIYSPAAVNAILALTRGQPYLVQLLCECVVVYVNNDKRKLVTVSDVEAAKPIAWERGAGYFKEFSDDWKPEQRNFIHRLLAHKPLEESDLVVIRQLIQAEIIEKDANGGYRFQVPLIEQYLRERYLV